jgi:hypothetical protein
MHGYASMSVIQQGSKSVRHCRLSQGRMNHLHVSKAARPLAESSCIIAAMFMQAQQPCWPLNDVAVLSYCRCIWQG